MNDETPTEILPAKRPTHVATYMRRASPDAVPTKIERKLTPTRKVKVAISEMVWSGAKRAEAAAAAGLTDHSLRAAFRRPHVKAAYLAELAVLRDSERARNVHALVDVRDGTNAMARVNASRALEEMADPGGRSINVNLDIRAGFILDLREDSDE